MTAAAGQPLPLTRFRVFGNLAAARAEFLQAQPVFHIFLILGRLVVALFAVGARQIQDRLIFRSHYKTSSNSTTFPTKPLTRIELVTSSLPRRRSTTELQRRNNSPITSY